MFYVIWIINRRNDLIIWLIKKMVRSNYICCIVIIIKE